MLQCATDGSSLSEETFVGRRRATGIGQKQTNKINT